MIFLDRIKQTLAEVIIRSLLETRKKGKNRGINKKRELKRNSKARYTISISIANIIENLKLNEVKESSREKAEEQNLEEAANLSDSLDNREKERSGGYGAIKPYAGINPNANYSDYDIIWSHIGTFKAKSVYATSEKVGLQINSTNESTGVLVSNEVIEKVEKHFKYFVRGEIMGDVGYVPPSGLNINSKDWEKYRMMTQMSIYRPLLKLIRAFA